MSSWRAASGVSVREGEPLSRHTALRTGGPCEAWVVAHHEEAVAAVVAGCRAEGTRLSVMGAGTRTIVRDGPVPGVVMRLGTGFSGIREQHGAWWVGAATPIPAVLEACIRGSRGGLGGLAGVPGSVGASLLLDEGWSEVVVAVSVLKRGRPTDVALEDVRGKRGAIVLGVTLSLPEANAEAVAAQVRAGMRGAARQPPGSWYASVAGEPVRDVFRSVRLHMVRLRQVAIPEAAPELLVNLGGGTAEDLALLARSAFERVKKVRGDQLAPRMRWMGSTPG